MRQHHRRGWRVVLPVATIGLLATACSSPGSDSADVPSQPAPTTSALPTGPVTLVVDDVEAANRDAVAERINAAFMAKYPNVTIKRIKSAFGDQQTKQPLTLSGPNPPDVVEIAVANDAFAKLGNQGLIVNLDDYAKQYGWVDKFPKSLLDQARFASDGSIGGGPLYGVYQVEDIIGVYYNKKKLADLGLSVPTSFEEFEAALARAKQAGEVPMMLGNLEGWPAGHVYGTLMNRYSTTEDINGWTFHTKDVDYASQPFLDATVEFQKWGTGGYFQRDFNAVTYDDATARFGKGEGLFLPAGTWITAAVDKAMGDNAGFFVVPPASGRPLQVEGGQGQFWAISGKSQNQAMAAAYLDFITSEEVGKILVENGVTPGFTMAHEPTLPAGVFSDVYRAIQVVNDKYAVSTFPDVATPSMLNTSSAGLQKLLVGKMSPHAYVESIKADYDKNAK